MSDDGIDVPTGGGALKGIGETFQPDLHTGTGNLSVPIPLPPGRRGLTPTLTLRYSTGTGNGPFGLGWSLDVPRVARRTDKGIPTYDDDTDVFVLSGAEELVPVPPGTAAPPARATDSVTRYRPRTEAGFARITHVTGPGGNYWEVRSADGLISRYGTAPPVAAGPDWIDPAVIADPDGGIFAWLLAETVDPLGNRVHYDYAADGPQRYLDTVRYADYGDPANPSYLVEVQVKYDGSRPDPFSDRRPGFELRTALRARDLQVRTRPGDVPTLATSVTLRYADDDGAPAGNGVSLVTGIRITGHDGAAEQDLPLLTFTYSDWEPASRTFTMLSGLPPVPVGQGGTELADLFGDGLPSVLELGAAARYWRNRGDGSFDPPRALADAPPGAVLGTAGVQLTDLDGDGRPELVVSGATATTSWQLSAAGERADSRAGFDPTSYRAAAAPTVSLADEQVRLVDLDGDHVPDLVFASATALCAFGDGDGGFGRLGPLPGGNGLPALTFTDPRLRFADMTGDGLVDVVLIHDGAVRYWPSLGYGRFGSAVVMADAPRYGDVAGAGAGIGFDPARLLLGDVVGDGTADIVYVADGRLTVWINQSGNGYGPPVTVQGTPRVNNTSAVRLADLTGAGISGVLWSSLGPAGRAAFLDLTGSVKPFLLTGIDNHAGASTVLEYATSTRFALTDRKAGRPWRTTLPFPVHVVARSTTLDAFSNTRLASEFTYHDGYWDPVDREFRGFGRVEQTDSLMPVASPSPVATQQPIDPLARPSGVPAGLDAAAAGNLLANWSFDAAGPPGTGTLTTTGDRPNGVAPAAAAGWEVRNAAAATTTTELVPSTLPYGRGGSMLRVQAGSVGCGVAQALVPSGDVVRTSVWVFVTAGAVALGGAVCSTIGRWTLLTSEDVTSDVAVLAADPAGADFYLDHGWARRPLGPSEPVDGPPLRTVSWFHLGAVGPIRGAWSELDSTPDYWPGDPPLRAHTDRGQLPASLPSATVREAVRGLRGRLLRTELYADDGTAAASRPYEVHDSAFELVPVLDGRTADDATLAAAPVVTVRTVLERTTTWDRGDDPMTRLTATGGYDDYSRAAWSLEVGVARGRDPRGPGSACLAVRTHTEHATRDDAGLYLLDRVTRTARWECHDDGSTPVLAFIGLALGGGADTELRDLTLTRYDGPAFDGLELGQLGNHGLPVRTERLVLTPAQLTATVQTDTGSGSPPAVPPYLAVDGTDAPSTWPSDYPPAFQDNVLKAPTARGQHLGYVWHPDGTGYAAGWYACTSRFSYDVQSAATGRGLPVVARDPHGGDTTTAYDDHGLLPVTVTSPAGLVTTAEYDYRTLRPQLVTDPNGNRTQIAYTPLGMPAWTARLGKDGAVEGDTAEQPGIDYRYVLTGWDDASPPQPMAVTTIQRVDHRWTLVNAENARLTAAGQSPMTDADLAIFFEDEETTHPERFLRTVEFTDGLGRLLQTRTQADDLLIDSLGLPTDPAFGADQVVAHIVTPDQPAVIVGGWTEYDNKGRPIRKWEPFFDTGWAYLPPTGSALAGRAVVTQHYDARSRLVRIVAADGSETITIPGVPADLADPAGKITPTPWEMYSYDAGDLAGKTHPTTSLDTWSHWNTPTSALLDAFGRTISSTARTDTGLLTTSTTYDIDGRATSATDALGRLTAVTAYDITGGPWLTWRMDAGAVLTVRDAAGGLTERRDDKGAIILNGYDGEHRATHCWAADVAGQVPTLRLVTVHGDAADSGLPTADALAANALGAVVATYDEAGLVANAVRDLDGNPLNSTRRILEPALLLPTGTWERSSYRIDWQPATGETLTTHAAKLLDDARYRIDATYDALGRRTSTLAPADAAGARGQLDYKYGRGGKVVWIAVDGVPHVAAVSYDAHGRRVLVQLGNGVLARWAYDPVTLRLARLQAGPVTKPSPTTWQPTGAVLQDYTYRYDLMGNPTLLADRTPGCGIPPGDRDALDRVFEYDALCRLVRASGREIDATPEPPWLDVPRGTDPTLARAWTETYAYDDVGTLTSVRHATDTAGTGAYTRTFGGVAGTNRLATLTVGPTTVPYTFDACGNRTTETSSRLFEWDYANLLVTFRVQTGAEPSQYAQYRYDRSGDRVVKLVRNQNGPGAVTLYLGEFERVIRTSARGTILGTHDTLQAGDAGVVRARIRRSPALPDDPAPDVTYWLTDHLGSAAIVCSADGTLVNREEYLPYGETSFGSYTHKRFRFTAKERDEESGLRYHGARYYAPSLGRWTSCDPAVGVQVTTPYAYARDNPLAYLDPTGRDDVPTQNTAAALTGVKDPDTASDAAVWTDTAHQEHIDFIEPPDNEGGLSDQGPALLAAGTQMTSDAAARQAYKGEIQERSSTAVEAIRDLRKADSPGSALKAMEEAKRASQFRDAARARTRANLSTRGAALSEVLDQTAPEEFYANKYGSPPEIRRNVKPGRTLVATEIFVGAPDPQGVYAYDLAEDLAIGAGKSRGGIAGLVLGASRFVGPALMAAGLALSVRAVMKAPAPKRSAVLAGEAGSFLGSLGGAELGSVVALGVGALLLGATPVGWAAFAIAFGGSLVGGYLFGRLGGAAARSLVK